MLSGAATWKIVCAVAGTVAAVVGCVVPVATVGGVRRGARGMPLLRAVAGGVVVATALMHTLPEGRAQLVAGGLVDSGAAETEPGGNATLAVHESAEEHEDDEHGHEDDEHGHEDGGHGHGHGYPFDTLFVMVGLLVTYFVEQEAHGAVGGSMVDAGALLGGMLTHSVLVGVSLGATSDTAEARGLSIALIVHQLCEAIAIGPAFRSMLSTWWAYAVFVGLYALSLPAGIGIGVLALLGDPSSPGASVARGVLSTLASGVLLYVGVVEFLAEAFGGCAHGACGEEVPRASSSEPVGDATVAVTTTVVVGVADGAPKEASKAMPAERPSVWMRLGVYVCATLGAAAMAILAIWS